MNAQEWFELIYLIVIIGLFAWRVTDWIKEWKEERRRRQNDSKRSDRDSHS